jgi:hypothetical protein
MVFLKQFREPLAVQFGVTNCGRDRSMSEVPLDDPDVGSLVDQSVSATVPQHVRVNREILETGCLSASAFALASASCRSSLCRAISRS